MSHRDWRAPMGRTQLRLYRATLVTPLYSRLIDTAQSWDRCWMFVCLWRHYDRTEKPTTIFRRHAGGWAASQALCIYWYQAYYRET